ncbi:hypothetical protein D3H65_03565 [Paraflavitalea soli]|uniref:VOC domain-containing protein n=1 Tax=Paraflavitalea soli TaxID=2315862 RepID=A0A3B7MIH0_9BACT|nr:VOC family protein [Paraflavitalea soli]AXY73103.1 hypothetical protein D3H65_03565 [Paraflavitalea soli]
MSRKIAHPCFSLLILLQLLMAMVASQAQTVKRPDIIGIAAVEVQVSDIKKAADFYQGLLGYPLSPLSMRGKQSLLIRVNQRQNIVVHAGLPAGQIERLLAIGLQTTDAAAMRQYLKSKGSAVPDTLTRYTDGSLSFAILDPENHLLQFIQYPDAGPNPITPKTGNPISARILHAGITIANLPLSDAFYKDILGFTEIWKGGATDSVTSWINMRLPESTDYIEYMLINAPPNKQQLGSLHHIALLVPDMQQAVDMLRPRATKTAYNLAPPRIGRNNKWQLNLYDPDGTRVELMEPFTFR